MCLKPNTVKYCDVCLSQRLKNWEIRERKKARDYSKETEREEERHREMVRINGKKPLVISVFIYISYSDKPRIKSLLSLFG